MHLKQVTLNNFRCFDSIVVPLHPRLTVLVAENGGGKTAVLDGIAVGLSPVLRQLSSANQRLSGPGIEDTDFRILNGGRGMELKAPFAQVILETTDGRCWDEWKPSQRGELPPQKVGKSALSQLGEILKSYATPQTQTLPVFAYYGAQRGLIEIPQRLRKNRVKGVDYSFPTSGLHGALDAQSDFKEMLKWFDSEESSELRRQKESEELAQSVTLDTVRRAVSSVLGSRYHSPHFNAKHKFCVLSDREPKKLQVSQLSQGYQSMLALVMDFARRLALANGHLESVGQAISPETLQYFRRWRSISEDEILDLVPEGPLLAPTVMLIDEVDLHLHPSWQQRVLGDLMRAFPHTQFIVTTHSPQVVSTVKPENIRMLRRGENGKWVADDRAPNTYGHSNSRSLEAVMGGRAYPEHLRTVTDLREYQRLVGDDRHDSPRALELRALLENVWGKHDPELQIIDISIRKNEALRKLRSQQK